MAFVNTGNTSIKDLFLLQSIQICSWIFVPFGAGGKANGS
jgi:hypothetical protein